MAAGESGMPNDCADRGGGEAPGFSPQFVRGRTEHWSDYIRSIRLELYGAIARVLLVRSLLRSSSTDRAIGVFRGVI